MGKTINLDLDLDLDSFEKSILSDIKKIRPKSKKRGYAKELVKKLYPVIEQSLANGCSYEEIAAAIFNKKVKIKYTTLMRYHKENKAASLKGSDNHGNISFNLQKDKTKKESSIGSNSNEKLNTNSRVSYMSDGDKSKEYSDTLQRINTKNEDENQHSLISKLKSSSLTDDDLFNEEDDLSGFNNY